MRELELQRGAFRISVSASKQYASDPWAIHVVVTKDYSECVRWTVRPTTKQRWWQREKPPADFTARAIATVNAAIRWCERESTSALFSEVQTVMSTLATHFGVRRAA